MASCCKFLGSGILCSCNCPAKSGHKVPIIFQNNCYFCSAIFCLCKNGKLLYLERLRLKGRALRYFKLWATFFYKSAGPA